MLRLEGNFCHVELSRITFEVGVNGSICSGSSVTRVNGSICPGSSVTKRFFDELPELSFIDSSTFVVNSDSPNPENTAPAKESMIMEIIFDAVIIITTEHYL